MKIFIISLTISFAFYIFYFLLKENIRGVEYQIYDAHIRIRYATKINEKVDYSIINIVVNDSEIDNTNILSYRKKITKLLIKLKEIKIKCVLIDIIFPEKSDNKTDDELITSVKSLSKVYLPFTYNEKKTLFNFNELQSSIYDSGFNNIYLSDDGVLRDLKILKDNGTSPSFFVSFKTACDYLGVKENNIVLQKNNIILKDANLPSGIKKDIRIPLTKDNNFLINYVGVFNKVFFTYRAEEITDISDLSDIGKELNDSIIIISNIKLFNNNIVKTPLEKSLFSSFVHSYLINSIITQNFIYYVENDLIYLILYILTLLFISFLFYYFNIDKIIIGYAILSVFIITLSFGIFILFNVYLNILISLFPLTFIFIAFLVNKYFNEKLNNFLFYIVTHDIKNELYNIALNSKIIKNLSTQENLLPHIETIRDSSEKLFDFTEKVIRLFKLKRNKLVLNYEKINLNETIKDILRKNNNKILDKNQSVDFLGQENIALFYGDKERIYEIFENIISNAIKYSDYNSKITINLEKNKKSTAVSIKDAGIGFSFLEKLNLFKEFSPLRNNPTGNEKKSGIGLYIVKKLINLHRGKIKVISRKGQGATFIVILKDNIGQVK